MKPLIQQWPVECAIGTGIILILMWLLLFPPLEVILFRFSAFWWTLAEAVRDFKRRRRELRKEAAAVAGWKETPPPAPKPTGPTLEELIKDLFRAAAEQFRKAKNQEEKGTANA